MDHGQGMCLRFAVTTPWGVELNKHVLGFVLDNFVIVVRDNDRDRTFLFLWDRLALNTRANLAVYEILSECGNVLVSKFLGLREWVLLVLLNVLDGKSWEFVGFEVKVASMCAERLGVNGGKVDGPLVLFGNGLKF